MTDMFLRLGQKLEIVSGKNRATIEAVELLDENQKTEGRKKSSVARVKLPLGWSLKKSWTDATGKNQQSEIKIHIKKGKPKADVFFRTGNTIDFGPCSIKVNSVSALKVDFEICSSISAVALVLESERAREQFGRTAREYVIKKEISLPLALTPMKPQRTEEDQRLRRLRQNARADVEKWYDENYSDDPWDRYDAA